MIQESSVSLVSNFPSSEMKEKSVVSVMEAEAGP